MTEQPTYGAAVLAVASEILATRQRFEGNPRLWNMPETEEDKREWLLIRTEFHSQLHGMQMALALMLGWPIDEGDKEGMVDVFLDFIRDSEAENQDVARVAAETEAFCRAWRPVTIDGEPMNESDLRRKLAGLQDQTFTVAGTFDPNVTQLLFPHEPPLTRVRIEVPDGRWQAFKRRLKQLPILWRLLRRWEVRCVSYSFDAWLNGDEVPEA